ncbi:MAG: glycosyltransferase family 39 protein [Planctomycetes bacterium]|nr:glycosyltransferase family 39 protein [Planctomycetota bacterium]
MDPSRPAGGRAGRWRAVALLGALTTLLKLWIVLCPGEHLAERWVLAEELHKGNIAQEVLDGPVLPLLDYHHVPNAGGTLVVGLLAVPAFLFFGPTLFAVRLVPIAFNLAAVVLLFLVLDRVASRRAAWIGGLFLAVATPGYALIAVTSEGSHTENNATTLLAVWLYFILRTDPDGPASRAPRRLATSALLGLVAGFALYFGYMAGIALLALALFELVCDPRCFLRPAFATFLLGFAAGFAPWIAFNATNEFAGTKLYGTSAAELLAFGRVASKAGSNLVSLVASYLPSSFFFVDVPGVPRAVLDWTYALALVALVGLGVRTLAIAARRARAEAGTWRAACLRDPRLALLAYLPVFLVAYALVDMQQAWLRIEIAHGGRYVTPLFPFLVMLAAIGADRLWERGVVRWTARALVALGLVGSVAVGDLGRAGEGFRAPGTSREELARWLAWRFKTDEARTERIVRELEVRGPPEVLDGVVFTFAETLKWRLQQIDQGRSPRPGAREELVSALAHLRATAPEELRLYCDPPVPGERLYRYDERALFRRDHAAGGLGRPAPEAAR